MYGETEYSPETHRQYDFILLPAWEIAKVGTLSVDLFINKNSLGEMQADAVLNYVALITKATRYFFHMNHDITPNTFVDGQIGLLSSEYPVSQEQFKLLFRYPDLGHLFMSGYMDFNMDIFAYLYERKKKEEFLGKNSD